MTMPRLFFLVIITLYLSSCGSVRKTSNAQKIDSSTSLVQNSETVVEESIKKGVSGRTFVQESIMEKIDTVVHLQGDTLTGDFVIEDSTFSEITPSFEFSLLRKNSGKFHYSVISKDRNLNLTKEVTTNRTTTIETLDTSLTQSKTLSNTSLKKDSKVKSEILKTEKEAKKGIGVYIWLGAIVLVVLLGIVLYKKVV